MSREKISAALDGIADEYKAEALELELPAGSAASRTEEKIMHIDTQKTKKFSRRVLTFALAACLILALAVTAYAVGSAVNSPKAAEKVAREELEKWKEMGLFSKEVTVNGPADMIYEIEGHTGSDYWYGRIFSHSYDVRWYMGEEGKYFLNLRVDTITGKIKFASIEARADETDVPVEAVELDVPVDPEDPDGEWTVKTEYLYDNFDDIFPADMTIDRFCSLLAEYWGFSGYTLADTVDESYYDAHWSAPDGSSLLKDMPTDNYYLTVFFEGDQEGAPMYIQLSQFPGRVNMNIGTGHAVG
ncbi:MAG: hypothetical protein K5771_08305 [Oscillospiraceae bacterium]|nr:hypothetical protein [Oscillospiraceae bacterium]